MITFGTCLTFSRRLSMRFPVLSNLSKVVEYDPIVTSPD